MSEKYQETWRTYFTSNNYQPLIMIKTDSSRILEIEEFCYEDGLVPEELSEIYLFCNGSGIPCELLVVIDIRGIHDDAEIKTLCKTWDNRILSFLNFGDLPGYKHQSQDFLKYSVLQILLSDPEIAHSPTALSEEKSTDTSRKLFISMENGDISETDRSMLPFYFDQLKQIIIPPEEESELEKILPCHDGLSFLYENYPTGKIFSGEELNIVKGWLIND